MPNIEEVILFCKCFWIGYVKCDSWTWRWKL